MGESDKQMSLIDETAEVIKFIEQAGRNAILSENAMHCRLSACHNLFSVLREGETTAEYVLKNLDLLISRFRKKNDAVSPATLKVYKSRVKSSVEDFLHWSRDPLSWEKEMNDKAEGRGREREAKAKSPRPPKRRDGEPTASPEAPLASTGPTRARRMSLPIRPDFDVEISIPADGLTAKELLRLELFLYSFCKELGQKENLTH